MNEQASKDQGANMRNYRAGSVMTDRRTILKRRRIKNGKLKKKIPQQHSCNTGKKGNRSQLKDERSHQCCTARIVRFTSESMSEAGSSEYGCLAEVAQLLNTHLFELLLLLRACKCGQRQQW